MSLSNLHISKKKYSKSLSWTWNLNFPPITVNNLFKFQAQDSDLEYFLFWDLEVWKKHLSFWKKPPLVQRFCAKGGWISEDIFVPLPKKGSNLCRKFKPFFSEARLGYLYITARFLHLDFLTVSSSRSLTNHFFVLFCFQPFLNFSLFS